jgi:hypothetical protein
MEGVSFFCLTYLFLVERFCLTYLIQLDAASNKVYILKKSSLAGVPGWSRRRGQRRLSCRRRGGRGHGRARVHLGAGMFAVFVSLPKKSEFYRVLILCRVFFLNLSWTLFFIMCHFEST